jgi:LacI family transcriptional regulator
MVRHLASIGHRRIAFISGPENNFDAAERLAGYREALHALGLEAGERVLPGDFSEESGYRAAQTLLAQPRREWPDAVFAANDMMALGCLFAFNEAQVRVPADIALAGVDDIPMARFVSPPLTTVRVKMAELGARALERLAAAIDKSEATTASTETMPAELVIRASCGSRAPAAPRRRSSVSGIAGRRAGKRARRKH